MASLLPTAIAQIVANAFQGKLMSGILRRENPTALDSDGNPVPVAPTLYQVQGIRDNFSAFFATFNGIPQTDVKILLIMNLIVPPTTPLKDDLIFIRDEWYMVRRVLTIDPASASVEMQCFQVDTPA